MKFLVLLTFLFLGTDALAAFSCDSQVSTPSGIKILKTLKGINKVNEAEVKSHILTEEVALSQASARVDCLKPKRTSKGGKRAAVMFIIYFQSVKSPKLVMATAEQLFLTSNSRVVPARLLKVGDSLIDFEGQTRQIKDIRAGDWGGESGHVTLIAPYSQSLNHRLAVVNGLVVGDKALNEQYLNLPAILK